MKPSVLLVALVLILTGCKTNNPRVWYRPGVTSEQLYQDWAYAHQQAAFARAVAPGVKRGGFSGSYQAASQSRAIKDLIPLTMQSRGYYFTRLQNVPDGEPYIIP